MAAPGRTDHYRQWSTLREIDQALGLPKGSSFRVFKQLEPTLEAGRDFLVLRPDADHDAIAALRAEARIYAASVNVVLLAPALASRIRETLAKLR